EITYGLERIALYLQKKKSIYELDYSDRVTYGDIHLPAEKQFSRYHFEEADIALLWRHFNEFEAEGGRLAGRGLVLPAYDCVVKVSHVFNVLDARGAVSVDERAKLIGRVRGLAKKVINLYLESFKPAPSGSGEPQPSGGLASHGQAEVAS
ncbi:MAG: glycine--tRNA ligase subunit alpha, partial [Elusimicrobiota bacterium]